MAALQALEHAAAAQLSRRLPSCGFAERDASTLACELPCTAQPLALSLPQRPLTQCVAPRAALQQPAPAYAPIGLPAAAPISTRSPAPQLDPRAVALPRTRAPPRSAASAKRAARVRLLRMQQPRTARSSDAFAPARGSRLQCACSRSRLALVVIVGWWVAGLG